jgi:hypothetical protein
VTGYSVVAIEAAAAGAPADAPRVQTGVRLGTGATSATLTLDAAKQYDIEVRSLAGARMSEAFAPVAPGTTPGEPGTVDTTAPSLSTSPALTGDTVVQARSITVNSDGDVFYTTDGTDPTVADMPSATAKLLKTGETIPVTAEMTLNVVAFDAAGNKSPVLTGKVAPAPAAAAVSPTAIVVDSFGAGRINLSWDAVADATDYRVKVFRNPGNGQPQVELTELERIVTTPSVAFEGLTPNPVAATGQTQEKYNFRISARTPAGTAFSSPATTVNQFIPGDDVTVGLARYRAGNEFRLEGTGTAVGATITFYRPNATNTGPGAAITVGGTALRTTVVAGATPAAGDWALTVPAPLPTNPGTLWIKSDKGGVASLAVRTD